FDIELLQAIAEQTGLQLSFEFGEWGAVQQRLQDGELDVVPMFVSPERTERFLFSEPFLHRYHLAFGRTGAPYISTLEELQGSRVAVQHAGLAADEIQTRLQRQVQ